MDIEDLTKQRIDYEDLPGGGVRAILTVTLQDGTIHTFTEEVHDSDLDAFSTSIATAEADAVEGIFGDVFKGIKKGVKSIGHVAKKVVTSKVFQVGAAALATVATGGAAAPLAAGAAAAALSVASKLATADVAKAAGAPKAAAKLIKAAALDAGKRAKGNPAATKDLLRIANDKRKKVASVIAASMPGAHPAAARPAPAPAAAPSADRLLAAAKAGKVRSNKPGGVSHGELLAAAKAGRVFWLSAA